MALKEKNQSQYQILVEIRMQIITVVSLIAN